MPRIKVPGFIGGAYTLRSVNVDCQRCVNLYPERDESGSGAENEVMSLRERPGLKLFATLFAGPIRGMWVTSGGRPFVVSGNTFCELLADGSALQYSTLDTSKGTVSMADNGLQLLMVDGDKGFIVSLDNGILSQITADGFPNEPEFAAFIDGYFLVNNAQSRSVAFSGLYDGLSWDGLDIFSKQAAPDNLRAMLPASGSLYCIGDYSYEVFYDTEDVDTPFQRIPGAFGEVGIVAPQTLKVVDRTPFFVGKDKHGQNMVFRFDGYRPVRVSTFAVEQAIDSYGDISKATAWGYQLGGHTFYNINFPNAKSTWSFDAAMGLWHEETSTDDSGQEHRHRAEHHVFAFGKHLVGDWQDGNIYQLVDGQYSDNGSPMTRRRTFPHFSDQQRVIFHRRCELYMETGVGCPGLEDTGTPVPISTVSGIAGFASNEWVRTVTVTTTTAHGFKVDQRVQIDGVADPTFDGRFTIYHADTPTTFVYVQPNFDQTLPSATSTGGTATLVL